MKFTRRDFLKVLGITATGAAALALAGCGGKDNAAASNTGSNNADGSSNTATNGAIQNAQSGTAETEAVSTPVEDMHRGGTVTLGITSNPTEFFTPYKQGTLNSYGWTVFEPLAWDRINGTYDPCLAESWEIDQDNKTMTVKIHEGISFSNGYPLTADDVVFTLTCRQEFGTYGLIGNPVSVEKLDDYTVKVTWENFSLNYAYWILPQYIYSQKTYEEKGLDWMLTNMVGTGPYVMNEYIPDVRLAVSRNENYWGETTPGPDGFEWICVTDQTAMLAAFLNGEIDNMASVQDPTVIAQLEGAGYEAADVPISLVLQYFAVPITTDPADPLSNPEVRKAIYLYGVDWDDLALTVSGEKSYHTDALGKPTMPYYEESLEVNAYDPEKAKKMLADAGYADGFTTSIYCMANMAGQATYLQDAMKKLGITVEIVNVDYTQINGEYLTGKAASSGIVMSGMAYNDYTTNQDDRFNKFFSPIGALKGITNFDDDLLAMWETVRVARSLEEQSASLAKFVKSYVGENALVWPMNNTSGETYMQPWYHVEYEAYATTAGRNPQYIWVEEH